jgi:hypothetical protein
MSMRLTIGVLISLLIAGVALASDTGRRDSYVFRDGDVTWMLGEGMSASALKEIQGRFGREFLWARRSGQIFVSDDDHVLDQARLAVQRNLTRSEQERRLALIADAALHRRSYVLAIDDTRTISAGTSIESFKGIRSRYPGRFLWVCLDGKSWLIQDPDWIDRASALFAGQLSLGPQQAAISREEAALDEEEERLDDRRDDASRARLEEVHRRQAEVSRREAELDEREEELEREAESKLWVLVDEAIRQGAAKIQQ